MGAVSRTWIVAASLGAVEALKDQGFCRWNNTIRSVHQHAKANHRSFSQANNKLSSPSSSSSAMVSSKLMEEKAKQSEESLRKVMYLSCWGPN
ncbi:Kallikrein-15 like [Actinidia chinensis var. chinensis]|uniref:Kallikrein-15 like n=1 Tax=Actinidia chinensis var. chinensis TaxID=1590841 RepID=A0A2R6QC99_ACTCC|nr:Kallikrein-15 like [Actinidia chinensis var. chinensis]